MIITVFTGHRIDEPGRTPPRFPATAAPKAAKCITALMHPGVAISSLANGGDILFQEAAFAAGLTRHIILPLPYEAFLTRSVATEAPGDWVNRAHTLWSATPAANRREIDVPPNENPFERCNSEMLTLARSLGSDIRFIALWDGKDSGRPGGTFDMIEKARALGAAISIIGTADLMT